MSVQDRLAAISEALQELVFEGWTTKEELVAAVEELEPLTLQTAATARDTRRLLVVIWALVEYLQQVLERADSDQ